MVVVCENDAEIGQVRRYFICPNDVRDTAVVVHGVGRYGRAFRTKNSKKFAVPFDRLLLLAVRACALLSLVQALLS